MALKHLTFAFLAVSLAFFTTIAPVWAEPFKIVGFGDSLMAGYGLNPGESFPEKLEKALRNNGHDVVITNASVSGDTTSGGLSRLDWSVPDGTQLVILELGANDMLRGIDPALVEQNLDKMLARLQERKIEVLLAGMVAAPNLGHAYGEQFGTIYPRLAEKYRVRLYPFFLDGVAGDPKLLLEDGMHPTAEGIDRMVAKALPTVEKALAGK
ncbi:arylesterase [Aminobacter aminovorans]|uniref:Acyl-CoA thioesterase-1 n=1 Tax=Aminobacter aminovorans TaxID=83263 RepID=A0AAC9AQ80_AMIAI|nr:arylesterase [Aminobacter aminovorans]AMS39868.1 G-D-S-L family lipolytic protein [Aminobacter aminovorans]MBB3707156.1 acyl-CoA thioesterase-1 [Aminobacter aminovorans]